jgi:hypothetical protein
MKVLKKFSLMEKSSSPYALARGELAKNKQVMIIKHRIEPNNSSSRIISDSSNNGMGNNATINYPSFVKKYVAGKGL